MYFWSPGWQKERKKMQNILGIVFTVLPVGGGLPVMMHVSLISAPLEAVTS